MAENQIMLRGTVDQLPVFSHESHGKVFYTAAMEVPRLSGVADRIDLLLQEEQRERVSVGVPVEVTGQARSFNNRSGVGSRLVITVLVRTLEPTELPPDNRFRFTGSLCKPPVFRRTPLGREICDLMMAVPRSYGRSDYLPCIAWGQNALLAAGLSVGEKVRAEGRLQSRTYIKVLEDRQEERVAYEVSLGKIEPL